MATHVTKMIQQIIAREGGYVNDPDDPGGETHFGISKRSYPKIDIKALTIDQATDIYYKDYYLASSCHLLPMNIQEIFLDMTVLHGKVGATKVLQETINSKIQPDIKVDGVLGPTTINHANKVEPNRLRAYRVKTLAQKVFANPTLEKYWYGWYQRATSV